jgi:predicted MPP superfamily phosphohydrolase
MRCALRAVAVGAALLLLFVLGGLWNATRDPVVVEQRVALEGLPPGTELRVLLLADTHFGFPDMTTRRLLRTVTIARKTRPDLVVMAGDYIGGKLLDWPRPWLEQALPPLAALDAPLGAYATLGNHDSAHWTPRVLALQVRPRLLMNEHVDVGPLVVAGVNSADRGPDVARALAGLPAGKPVLIVMHEPDYIPHLPPPDRPMLVVSGHTHGGQIVLPVVGAVSRFLYRDTACLRGLCRINGWDVFVTSGVGTSILPIRYGVRPEVVVLTLYSVGRNSGTEK